MNNDLSSVIAQNTLVKLGSMYSGGIYVEKDLVKSSNYYREAINAGNGSVISSFVSALWWINTSESINELIEFATNESEKGNPDCSYWLGRAYHEGKGVDKDEQRAYHYYLKSFNQGRIKSLGDLLDLLWNIGDRKSIKLFIKTALSYSDNGEAQLRLARAYYIGKGVRKDITTSYNYYSKAIVNGVGWATDEYYTLLTENGSRKDIPPEETIKCAENGNIDAIVDYAKICSNPSTVYFDRIKAINLCKKAIKAGRLEASSILFDLLWGMKTKQCYKKMIEYASEAAKQGDCESMGRLGRAYKDGFGVKADLKESIYWYSQACLSDNNWAREYVDVLVKDASPSSIKELKRILPSFETIDVCYYNRIKGNTYRDGIGEIIDYNVAKQYYEKSYEDYAVLLEYCKCLYCENGTSFLNEIGTEITLNQDHQKLLTILEKIDIKLVPLFFLTTIVEEKYGDWVYNSIFSSKKITFDSVMEVCHSIYESYQVYQKYDHSFEIIDLFQYMVFVSINYIIQKSKEKDILTDDGVKSIYLSMKKMPELSSCRASLLSLLKEFDIFCKENNIDYWISEGSLLGAVRHTGFIPWDDDLDICMTRGELSKLKQIIGNSSSMRLISEKLILSDTDVIHRDKIYFRDESDQFNEIFIDIFAMDYCKDDSLATWSIQQQIRKEMVAEIIARGNDSLEVDYDLEEKYLKKLNDLVNPDGKGKYLMWSITNFLYWKKRIHSIDNIFPTIRIQFEDMMVRAPRRPSCYSSENYADIWEFPYDILSHRHGER